MELINVGNAVGEARRSMEICNACRYCEGFCAVFPAMELRRSFSQGDLEYMANLCHNCTGCYHACQYTTPHPFNLNVPEVLTRLRLESYEKYAWPGFLARAFRRNGLLVSLVTAFVVALVVVLVAAFQSSDVLFAEHHGAGAFYRVVSYDVMLGVASVAFLFAILALVMGVVNFWRGTGGRLSDLLKPRLWHSALKDALTLRYLGGGGEGCNDEDEGFSNRRRWFHQIMMYGFLLCFAATCVASVYDRLLAWPAPYGYFSPPVILGTLGGLGLIVGPLGLVWIKLKAHQAPMWRQAFGMDIAFLALLVLVSLTGLLLLALRETTAMGSVLAVHLGVVAALFVVLPYSKFVHAFYRFAALMRYAQEKPH